MQLHSIDCFTCDEVVRLFSNYRQALLALIVIECHMLYFILLSIKPFTIYN